MNELLIYSFLIITIVVTIEYYKQLTKVKKEYVKAKGIVTDIILSFKRELQKEREKLERVIYQIDTISSKNDDTENLVKKNINQIQKIELRMKKKLQRTEEINGIAKRIEEINGIAKRIEEINGKIPSLIMQQNKITEQVASIEKTVKPTTKSLNTAIPIRKDKALASLNETEIVVLKILMSEGSKTVPEIKEKINLSREHTARLMKKLYDKGYLERNS
ncbi:MAG: MarR family transcriptional regulator, partial [Candidatus Hodarchaeota archaeon]